MSLILLSSCDDSFKDDRSYQSARIVAVKLNNVLYNIAQNDMNEAKVVLPAGTNLKDVKTEILVSNGTVVTPENNVNRDLTKPIDVSIYGQDGQSSVWKLIVQSPPSLTSLTVAGLPIAKDKIFFGKTSIIVQIPVGTDITKLAVSYEFKNGTLNNYVNGTEKDYTFNLPSKAPFSLEVLGADGVTIYKYDVVFTSEKVGPAKINSMVINGDTTSEIIIVDADKNIIQPVVPYLTNFSDATVVINAAFGNTVDPNFKGTNVNTLLGFKVKATGTDGIEREFTVKNPIIKMNPLLEKSHAQFNFSANAGSSAAFSNGKIVIATNAVPTGSNPPAGIQVFDLSGNYLNNLDKGANTFDTGALFGIRKLATDDNGKILGVHLGNLAAPTDMISIVKWNSATDTAPTKYITFSQTSLGLTSAPRTAGISISGSLDGDATITVPLAQKTNVLIWKVTGGVLNPTPTQQSFPYSGTGFYYSVQPDDSGFVGASVGTSYSGLNLLSSSFSETFKTASGNVTTDCKTIVYKGRKYIAYVAFIGGKHVFRLVDYTTASTTALESPILEVTGAAVSNANNTTDADFAVINGKLHVLYYGTNDKLAVYKLEQ
ncbi:hypothetical protein FLGSB24_24940 [Flavobacterium sp. GSB-24]|nr:hypothetical protein FLGSB24_24940 [Flavobacterium sp. GSB-24]